MNRSSHHPRTDSPVAPGSTPRLSIPVLALGMAVVSGLLQNGARLANRLLSGQPLDHGVHAWWLTPLGDLIVFGVVLATLQLIGKRVPRATHPTTIWFAVVFTLGLTALQFVPRLHPLSRTLLVLGMSVVAAPRLASSVFVLRALRPATKAVSGITLLIAMPLALWPPVREWLDQRRLVEARPDSPNVLILLLDTVRAASLDLYGHSRPTSPNLTELAAGGVTFDRAVAPASYTLPSHASLFTGRWPHELSASWRVPLDGAAPTLGEVFAAAGYRTGAFSANRIFVTREWGLGRGFAHFEEHRLGLQQLARSTALMRRLMNSAMVPRLLDFYQPLARVHASANGRALLRWLERDRQRPYFAFVNFFDAHAPYLPPDSLATRFGWLDAGAGARERAQARLRGMLEPEELGPLGGAPMQRAYEGVIAELDGEVGKLMRDLRARGLLSNTIVVIASDHGEEFGEHGLYNHGNSLYFRSLHVPLVMLFPGHIPPGTRVAQTVSLRNVAATLIDLANVQGNLPGESLRPLWDSASGVAGPAFSEIRYDPRLPTWSRAATGDMTSVVDSSLQLIRYGDGSFEAFDLSDMSGVTKADSLSHAVRRLQSLQPPARR